MKEKLSGKYRLTHQREIILEELRRLKSHPTADELYGIVRQRIPKISLGTVYRNLEILTQCGLVSRLDLAGNQKRYDGCTSEHFHLRCIDCGTVLDLPELRLGIMELAMKTACDFDIRGYRLEFTGICSNCRITHS
jgi:Fur family transcriptional regulator, ferric uptake regulator